jgi:uncharacterized membrane-anchored protein YitT (DUF2179 family)
MLRRIKAGVLLTVAAGALVAGVALTRSPNVLYDMSHQGTATVTASTTKTPNVLYDM